MTKNEKIKMEKCSKCGKEFPLKKLYIYVDASNSSITENSLSYCYDCYLKIYPNDRPLGLNFKQFLRENYCKNLKK